MTLELRSEAVQAGIDWDEALERLGGDEALFVEVAGIMVADSRELLARLRTAVEQGEAKELRAAAHKAKGSLLVFGRGSACQLASELERFGSSGEIAEARRTLPAFESELGRMLATLSRIAAA